VHLRDTYELCTGGRRAHRTRDRAHAQGSSRSESRNSDPLGYGARTRGRTKVAPP